MAIGETETKTENTVEEALSKESFLVVEIGKGQTRKKIRGLRKGKGKLFSKVTDALGEIRESAGIEAAAQTVVVVVKQKARKRWGMRMR